MQEIKDEDPDIRMHRISQSDHLILRNNVLKVSESHEILDIKVKYCTHTKYGLDELAALFEQLLFPGKNLSLLRKQQQNN